MIQTVYTGKNHSIPNIYWVEAPNGKGATFGNLFLVSPIRWLSIRRDWKGFRCPCLT